ncbi:uncharacterized protein LOC134535335 [Bacillus rossius redtenbacheri]|uniref:uncharacterized protein LOC134535335 n=1 Tax=Bacillus rossius redtenbacheri TaxID=93214 RepID=UPI002FDD0991
MGVCRMNHHRDSETPLASDHATTCTLPEDCGDAALLGRVYPFALVLRLRVLQVVCGISGAVMGTVAAIEERGDVNLGLGVPAGCATVLAAAVSIHTSRGFSGYQPAAASPRMRCARAALWCCACALHAALAVLAAAILSAGEASSTLTVLAGVELGITGVTAAAVLALLWIDCRYDPD